MSGVLSLSGVGSAVTRGRGQGYNEGMSSPYQPPSYGPGPPDPYAAPPRTEPKAVIALVLAVAAWLPIVPFVGAIAALVLCGMARRDIVASRGALVGLGMVSAARVIAWVHLIVVALLFALFLAAVFGLFAFSLFGVHVG